MIPKTLLDITKPFVITAEVGALALLPGCISTSSLRGNLSETIEYQREIFQSERTNEMQRVIRILKQVGETHYLPEERCIEDVIRNPTEENIMGSRLYYMLQVSGESQGQQITYRFSLAEAESKYAELKQHNPAVYVQLEDALWVYFVEMTRKEYPAAVEKWEKLLDAKAITQEDLRTLSGFRYFMLTDVLFIIAKNNNTGQVISWHDYGVRGLVGPATIGARRDYEGRSEKWELSPESCQTVYRDALDALQDRYFDGMFEQTKLREEIIRLLEEKIRGIESRVNSGAGGEPQEENKSRSVGNKSVQKYRFNVDFEKRERVKHQAYKKPEEYKKHTTVGMHVH